MKDIVASNEPLAKLSAATTALAECSTLEEVKRIVDIAEAARTYARAAKLGLEAQNHAAELKLRAERKAGELLRQLERGKPGPKLDSRLESNCSKYQEVLEESNIPPITAHRWQQEAAIPDKVFEEHIAEVKAEQREVTSAGLLRLAQEAKQQERLEQKRKTAQDLPSQTYNVIYADPPWEYSNTGLNGAAQKHYPTMPLDELCLLPQTTGLQISASAVLFLWTTNPLLEDAFEVIRAWGFAYKTNIVWVKSRVGTGFYVRGLHELLLIATRGSFTPLETNHTPPITSVVDASAQEHSRKPDEVYDIIERLYPGCNYIELFARRKRAGWHSFGNEVQP